MKNVLLESVTDRLRVFCNILAFIVPYVVYKINLKLHEVGDPPWKKAKRKRNRIQS